LNTWRTNLRILWLSQFIAMIGMSGVIPFLPLYVRDLGVAPADAPLWSGVIISAPFMMAALLTPLWGSLGDKYGQKAMVLRAVAGLGITVSLMGFAPNIWVLLVLRLAQGAASGFVASNNAFVSAQTPQEHAGYALGMLQTSISAGNIIGPLIGGAIADAFGFRDVFFLVGGLCFVSFVIAWRQLKEERTSQSGKRASVRHNLGIAMRDDGLRRLLLILVVSQTAVVLTSPIFPYYLQELGAPQEILGSLAGAVVSIVGVATLISAPWWGKRSDRIGYQRAMFGATLIVSIGMAAQAIVPSYEWIFPIRLIIGLAVGALLPLTYGELTRRAPAGRRGGIMGLASSATLIGNLIGPLLCAAITSQLPLFMAFVTASGLMLVVHFVSRRGYRV
jgi:MFS family permease